jgi:type II secretory pathway component PulF
VVGSLAYPALLVVAGIGILAAIFALFIPKFKPLFADMPDLPLTTRLVFGVSDFLGSYGLVLLAIIAAAIAIGWRLSKRPKVRRWASGVKTRGPVIGPLVRALAAARFCRMLGTMLGNGIAMLTAMQIAKEAAGNLLMEEAIDKAADAVRSGQTLSRPLAESGLFSDDVIEMIAVAETANNLDEILITIAATIEARVDRMLSTVIRLIEPLLLMSIAAVVVVVAAGLILPMTKLKAGF